MNFLNADSIKKLSIIPLCQQFADKYFEKSENFLFIVSCALACLATLLLLKLAFT